MINKDVQSYEMEIGAIRRELCKLPEGHLNIRGSCYYETIGTSQKGITKDRQKVWQLARKAYLQRRLRNLEWNFSLVKKQSDRYMTEDPMEIIRSLPSFFKVLPTNCFFHPSVHDQLEKVVDGNMWRSEELVYLTGAGIRVRSKSERIIADALDQKEITYRYEAKLVIGGVSIHPDFTIYRPFDGKMILWEHFGLMDNEGYRKKTIEKLYLYAQHGFVPLDNMICTFEKDLRDPVRIDTIIKLYLLS